MGVVTELRLTAERRGELAAPLNDGQRLRAKYPKVAEYPDMAPMLSGTGDVAGGHCCNRPPCRRSLAGCHC